MFLVRLIDFLRDRLGLVIKASLVLLALLALADVARVFLSHGHEAAAEHAASAPTANDPLPTASAPNPYRAPATVRQLETPNSEHASPATPAHAFWSHLHHIAETWPVFWSVFGFLACVVIVFVSKWYGHLKIGRTEIMTREDYYHE